MTIELVIPLLGFPEKEHLLVKPFSGSCRFDTPSRHPSTEMASSVSIVFAMFLVAGIANAEPLVRRKRSLVQLEEVMQCATQLPGGAYEVFSKYNCYGCWCGKGGQGETVDGIDA